MHIKISDFLINENIKQMRQYLVKKGIERIEPSLDFIKKKFEKKPNYIYIFTKIMVSEDGKINGTEQQFDAVAEWVIHKNHLVTKLPKKIQDYTSIEELQDDISRVNLGELSSKYYHSLYSDMRDQIEKLSVSDRAKMDTVTASFMLLDEDFRKSFPPLLYFKANLLSVFELRSSMENFIESGEVNSTKKGVLSVIEGNEKAIIVHDKDNVLIIQSNDRDVILSLGSNRWCIVYSPDNYLPNYVGGEGMYAQFLCFNFNLPQSNKYSLFGVSIDMENKALHGACQDRENGASSIDKIVGCLNIKKTIFTNPFIKVMEDILLADDPIIRALELVNLYGVVIITSMINKDQLNIEIILNIEQKLASNTPNLFGDEFSLYSYLDALDFDFDSDLSPLYIKILLCIQSAILKSGLGNTDFKKFMTDNLGDDVRTNLMEEMIPEDYYDYPDDYQTYANTVELFNITDGYDETEFAYIVYEHTKKGSDINLIYREKLTKELNLDQNDLCDLVVDNITEFDFCFEEDITFMKDGHLEYYNNNNDDWQYNLNFSIHNILNIYEHLSNSFDLDHKDLYEKHKEQAYKDAGYTKSKDFYSEFDRTTLDEISTLNKYVVGIIEEPYDYVDEVGDNGDDLIDEIEEIRDILNRTYNSAYESALYDEYFDRIVSKLGTIFNEQIGDDDKKQIYTHTTGGGYLFKLDIFKMLREDKNFLANLINEQGSFTPKDVLYQWFSENGSLRFQDVEYASIDDDYINDLISDEF